MATNFIHFEELLNIHIKEKYAYSYNFSHVMRKPVYIICEQQRRRSACASEISILYLASVAAQARLCLTWSQTPKTGFHVTKLIFELWRCIATSCSSSYNSNGATLNDVMIFPWRFKMSLSNLTHDTDLKLCSCFIFHDKSLKFSDMTLNA